MTDDALRIRAEAAAAKLPPGLAIRDDDFDAALRPPQHVQALGFTAGDFEALKDYCERFGVVVPTDHGSVCDAALGDGVVSLKCYDDFRRNAVSYWPPEIPNEYRFKAGDRVVSRINHLVPYYSVLRVFEKTPGTLFARVIAGEEKPGEYMDVPVGVFHPITLKRDDA